MRTQPFSSFFMQRNRDRKQNLKAAKAFAENFEKICRGGLVSDAGIKFHDVAMKYFEEYAPKKLKDSTVSSYKWYYENDIEKAIGYKPIGKITTQDLQSFINDLCDKHMSKRTVKTGTGNDKAKDLNPKSVYNCMAIVSSIFAYAISQGIVADNPCRNVIKPKKKTKEVEVYALKEVQDIIKALETESPNRRMTILLAILCGFRRGEIYGLEWDDIDFNNATISIKRNSLHTKERGTYTDETKTKKSTRCLPVSGNIISALQEYKKWQAEQRFIVGSEWVNTNRLFTQWNGEAENPSNIENWCIRFCSRKGIRYIKFHSLRHFNATQLIATGADIKTVSSSLGHSNINTTLDIYVHSVAEQQAKAAQALDDKIGIKLSKLA